MSNAPAIRYRRDNLVMLSIDLARIRQNTQAILHHTGVPVIAVVKANAYGHGAVGVAEAIGDLVEAFYVFDAAEALAARLWDITGKRTIALNSVWNDPEPFIANHIHPVVWTVERARTLRKTRPVLAIDTGQQRFACPISQTEEVMKAGGCGEVMTHAVNLPQVNRMLEAVSKWPRTDFFLHAAGTVLLDEPSAWFNAVRPGLALYEGAMKVTARLVEVHESTGPAGYSGFLSKRFGVILAGYSHGVKRGPCFVNGNTQTVIEVGMQSAFVTLEKTDKVDDEVELLGANDHISAKTLSVKWGCSQQEVMLNFSRLSHCRINY